MALKARITVDAIQRAIEMLLDTTQDPPIFIEPYPGACHDGFEAEVKAMYPDAVIVPYRLVPTVLPRREEQ